ncbi:MAG: type I restriction endonuclease subunit S [Sulfurimonas sp.]|nr:MAG: type I restriction endonuclease subunit S [Sulfurimonas sp.]
MLPIDWSISTIGEIADVTKLAGYEYTEHFKYIKDGEIIALRALNVRDGILDLSNIKRITKDVSERLPRSKLFIGDILFTYIGANIGQFALVDKNDKYHLAPNICRIRSNKDFNKYFLYSYIRTDIFQNDLENYSGGSSQPTLPMKNIRLIKVPHPPLKEQNSIVEIVSSIDDKIDLLLRQNKTLEKLAQTLFRQWFIEEAKDEWEEKSLSKIANFLNGLACQKFPPLNDTDKLPVLKIKDLKGGISNSSDWSTTDIKPEYIIESGDVIFAWSASLMVKIWDGEKCILNQHLFKVTSDDYPKWFYYQWCKYHLANFIAIAQAHATTMGHIKRGDLDNAICVVPTDDEMKVMSEQIVPLMDKMENNSKQIKTLENMRDTLLPKLMSGEVRVI